MTVFTLRRGVARGCVVARYTTHTQLAVGRRQCGNEKNLFESSPASLGPAPNADATLPHSPASLGADFLQRPFCSSHSRAAAVDDLCRGERARGCDKSPTSRPPPSSPIPPSTTNRSRHPRFSSRKFGVDFTKPDAAGQPLPASAAWTAHVHQCTFRGTNVHYTQIRGPRHSILRRCVASHVDLPQNSKPERPEQPPVRIRRVVLYKHAQTCTGASRLDLPRGDVRAMTEESAKTLSSLTMDP